MRATDLYEIIQEELTAVEEKLGSVWMQGSSAGPSMLDDLLGHVLETPGKRTRPAITILASRFHPHDHDLPMIMATAVELLHIATLVHDDTVDNSAVRRGKATVSSRWGRNIAVLVGRLPLRHVRHIRMRHQERPGHPAVLGDHHGAFKG